MTPGTTPADAGGHPEDGVETRATPSVHARRVEFCEACGDETFHEVRVELRTESAKRENAEFSREPYRVAVCEACGGTAATRMNNA